MTLVELCAGSAAVSLRALSARARPPLAYQGGKRGYADAILAAMGIQPGGWRGDVVLVEPGPWGEAWEHWRRPEGRSDTIERLRAWAEEDPRALWERLRASPVPADVGERVATWAVLACWSYAAKPIAQRGARWTSHGFDVSTAYPERTATLRTQALGTGRLGGALGGPAGPVPRAGPALPR